MSTTKVAGRGVTFARAAAGQAFVRAVHQAHYKMHLPSNNTATAWICNSIMCPDSLVYNCKYNLQREGGYKTTIGGNHYNTIIRLFELQLYTYLNQDNKTNINTLWMILSILMLSKSNWLRAIEQTPKSRLTNDICNKRGVHSLLCAHTHRCAYICTTFLCERTL